MTASTVRITGGSGFLGSATARAMLGWQPRSREDALVASGGALVALSRRSAT